MYGAEADSGQFGADWNGDHTFSQSAADFSLQEYIEPEVAQKNPQLSPTDIHVEAVRIFSLRSAQDQLFDQKEARREEDMVTKWEVADIDGKKQLTTQYGDRYVSLEELWRHTEEFALRTGKSGAFNSAEMQTQLAIQDALIAGQATSVAFTLSHPESVRYVQQWQRGESGVFYSTQIDIGRHAGRDLRHDEVKGFLDRFRDQHRDTAIEVEGAVAGSYVAVRGVLDMTAISRTARLHTMTIGVEMITRRLFPDYLSSRSSPDTSDGAFPLWVISDRRWFSENKRENIERLNKEKKDTSEPEKLIKIHEKESSSDGRVLPAVRTSLIFIAETGVAIHAMPIILARLGEKLPTSARVVEKSVERHTKKELRKKKKEASVRSLTTTLSSRDPASRGVAISYKDEIALSQDLPAGRQAPRNDIPSLRSKRVESLKKGKERKKRKKRGPEKGTKTIAAASEKIPSASEKREGREKRSPGRAAEKSVRRHEKRELKRETKKDSVKVQPLRPERVEPLKERKRSIQRKEREAVAGMVFGWMVWKILNRANFPPGRTVRYIPPVESKLAMLVLERRGAKPIHPPGEQSQVWVFLSIIWYLTAIREQGMHNYPMKKKRRKLPKKGIIFAYAS